MKSSRERRARAREGLVPTVPDAYVATRDRGSRDCMCEVKS